MPVYSVPLTLTTFSPNLGLTIVKSGRATFLMIWMSLSKNATGFPLLSDKVSKPEELS